MSNAAISCDKKCLQTAAVKTILTIVKLKNVGLFNFHIMKGLECMERTKIAIADDNQSILEALRSVIDEEDDMRIVGTADNGADTVKMIHESQPDVVLLDLIMPGIDGITVMEKVRADKTLDSKPDFIVISAIGRDSVTEDAFNMGAAYYIMKPFDNEVLVKTYLASICGTDKNYSEGKMPREVQVEQVDGNNEAHHAYPLKMGHEAAGVIVEVGKNVTDFKVGDKVMSFGWYKGFGGGGHGSSFAGGTYSLCDLCRHAVRGGIRRCGSCGRCGICRTDHCPGC